MNGEKFAKIHSKDGPPVSIGNGWLLFPDAAMCLNRAQGNLCDPPDDPYQLAKLQLQYHETLLNSSTQQFAKIKQAMILAAENAEMQGMEVASDEEDLAHLKRLQATVRKHQRMVRECRKRIEEASETPVAVTMATGRLPNGKVRVETVLRPRKKRGASNAREAAARFKNDVLGVRI